MNKPAPKCEDIPTAASHTLVVKIKITRNLPTILRKIMENWLSEEDPFIDKKKNK